MTHKLVRISAVVSTTELLPLIHILRYERAENTVEILLWYSIARTKENDALMRAIASAHAFAACFHLIGFELQKPRTAGALAWPFEFIRRNQRDAAKLRMLLRPFLADADTVEIWTDEPIHFPMQFLHAAFPNAVHVKIPHCFDLESAYSEINLPRFLDRFRAQNTFARRLLWKATSLIAGVKYDATTGLVFDRAYTFDIPNSWSQNYINLSHTITLKELIQTYNLLPPALRQSIASQISDIGHRPRWALIVLFGMSEAEAEWYHNIIKKIFFAHPQFFQDRQIILKPHPGSPYSTHFLLGQKLAASLQREVKIFNVTLNLEMLWHLLPVDIVIAPPCGSLAVIRRLNVARVVVMKEVVELFRHSSPLDAACINEQVRGFELV